MKKLYTFKEVKKEKVLTKKSTENEKGEKVTVEKEEEREVSHEFFMRKPNRRLYDDADLYYAVKLSEGIKAGLLTKALLEKRYDNDGGVLSNTEIENYGQMYVDFYNKQQAFVLKPKKLRRIPIKTKAPKPVDKRIIDIKTKEFKYDDSWKK